MAAFGKLVVTNVVTTYCLRVVDKKKANEQGNREGELDLVVAALVGKGNYGPSFPAVQNKGLLTLRRTDEEKAKAEEEDDDSWFPLVRRAKAVRAIKDKKKNTEERLTASVPFHATDILKATNAVFESGSVVVAGGTTVNENRLMAYTYIRRYNHDTLQRRRIYNFYVVNIVSCTDLGFELNCEWMCEDGQNKGLAVLYNPEEFHGLSWSTEENGVTIVFVIFDTGKVIATSMKTMDHVPIAERRIQRLVAPFRKGSEPAGYQPVKHMRDADTIAKVRVSATSKDETARSNAALRHQRKMAQDVRARMKQMSVVCALNDGMQVVLHESDEFGEQFLKNELE